jgi:hypothetical protein
VYFVILSVLHSVNGYKAMSRKIRYDIDANWDDPCERVRERRSAPRCRASFLVKIAASVPESPTPLVGPGRVDNLSTTGLRCLTKHRLRAGESVQVAVPTKEFPEVRDLPRSFVGAARVVRADTRKDSTQVVCLQFDEDLSSNMDFSLFWDHLNTLSTVQAG